MGLSVLLLNQIISMVLMALAGYALGRFSLVTGEQSRVLSYICVYLAMPCSLIVSFGGQREVEKLEGLALGLAAAVGIHILFLSAGKLLSKGKYGLTNEEQASVLYNNAGNLIIPIVRSVLGAEYVIYTTPYLLVQNTLIWTHGQALMGGRQELNIKQILTTPAIIGIITGLVIFIMRIPLPTPLYTAMEGLGGCIAPLSMLIIGIIFSELDLRQILLYRRIYLVSLIRLLLLPLFSVLVLLGLKRIWPHSDSTNILTVNLLCSIAPTASLMTQQAQLFHNPNVKYVSAINVLTTFICAITMPVVMAAFLTLI